MNTTEGRRLRVVAHHLAPGRHLLIDPCYAGETEAVRARAAHTWFTGSDGGFECTASAAALEGAEGRRAQERRLRADLTIGVDTASIVLIDEQGLGTLEATLRLDVGAYVEVEPPHGAELHVPDDGAPMRFTMDVRGPQGRVVQHDYRPEASARADTGARGSPPSDSRCGEAADRAREVRRERRRAGRVMP